MIPRQIRPPGDQIERSAGIKKAGETHGIMCTGKLDKVAMLRFHCTHEVLISGKNAGTWDKMRLSF